MLPIWVTPPFLQCKDNTFMCEMQITIFNPARSKCEKYLHFRVGQIAKNNENNVAVTPNVFLDADGIIREKRHHYMGQLLSYCHNFFEQSSHQLVPQIFNNADTESPS